MADFTGMTVRLTLKNPPNFMLEGRVSQVIAGQTLTVQDVFFPSSGSRAPSWTVRGTDIQDLQVVNTSIAQPKATNTALPSPVAAGPHVRPLRQDHPPQQPRATAAPQQAFVDPAILSYARSPVHCRGANRPNEPVTPIKSILAKAAESLPTNGSPFVGEAGRSVSTQLPAQPKEQVKPTGMADSAQEAGEMSSKKKVRRGQKKKSPNNTITHDPPMVMNADVSRNGNDMNGSVRTGKGWRQTPLLQPSPQPSSPAHKTSTRKNRRMDSEAQQNGWATEDATDIQEMGEFDFEANHKLFDKKTVFDQLRQGDTTADEERLVSHNKLPPRPGTYGGKNYHPTENVLSPKVAPKDSSSDADTELNFGASNARSTSRHSTTRSAAGKKVSRQNSSQVEARPHPLSASLSSERAPSRSRGSLPLRPGRNPQSLTTSPLPERTLSPHSAVSGSRAAPTSIPDTHSNEPHLAIYPSMTPCPVLHPAALETLEQETVSRYGILHEAITENAARCIVETAMSVFHSTSGSRRGSRTNTIRGSMSSNLPTLDSNKAAPPVVVVLAGNHTTGARAVAAARHLLSRQTHIILAEAQYDGPETQDLQMKTQIAILKRIAKTGAPIKRGPWRRAYSHIRNLPSPPAVIIDALLAGETYDSILESSSVQAAEAKEMIEWANRSRAPVLSVSCPSGVSGLDGGTTTVEGEPLAVRPDRLLCLAAPMQGVFEAMAKGERWEVQVADLGVNVALRVEEAVGFGNGWVVDIKFVEGGGLRG